MRYRLRRCRFLCMACVARGSVLQVAGVVVTVVAPTAVGTPDWAAAVDPGLAVAAVVGVVVAE